MHRRGRNYGFQGKRRRSHKKEKLTRFWKRKVGGAEVRKASEEKKNSPTVQQNDQLSRIREEEKNESRKLLLFISERKQKATTFHSKYEEAKVHAFPSLEE